MHITSSEIGGNILLDLPESLASILVRGVLSLLVSIGNSHEEGACEDCEA